MFILQIGHVRWIKYLNKLCVHFIANQLNGYFLFSSLVDQLTSLWFKNDKLLL